MTDTPTPTAEATLADRISQVLAEALETVGELARTDAAASGCTYSGLPGPLAGRIRSEVLTAVHGALRKSSPEMVGVPDLNYSPKPGRAWK